MLALAGAALTLLFAPGCDDDDDPVAPAVAFDLNVTSGNNQTLARSAVSAPMVVTLLDQYGDPMAGQVVTWDIETGGGSLASETSVTDNDGGSHHDLHGGPRPGCHHDRGEGDGRA
jgi:hypothetical protein